MSKSRLLLVLAAVACALAIAALWRGWSKPGPEPDESWRAAALDAMVMRVEILTDDFGPVDYLAEETPPLPHLPRPRLTCRCGGGW